MKVSKLHMDNRPGEQPTGTKPFGKNGVQSDITEVSFNEPGFTKMAAVVPYKLIGVIETDSKPILFSTDNESSAIGYFNPANGTYEPIINDRPGNLVNWPNDGSRLDFNMEYYIKGQSQRNYKGEMVATFTDKRTWPKYLNCDNPSIESLDDLRLFSFFTPPKITTSESLGGSLPAGAYYVAVGYERNDGTSTPYSTVSAATIITPSESGTTTDKALTIKIEETDTTYDNIRIAIISKVQGVTKAVELADFMPISESSIEFTYTGDNLTTDITVESILVKPSIYNRVGTIGQLNDYLYIGDLDEEPDINDMQPYALSIRIEWKSEIISAINPPAEHVNGKKKGQMHEEVYAFYARYKKTRGGFTKWFVIAGESPIASDTNPSSEATAGGEVISIPKFKVEDTIHYFNSVDKTGACGVYINDTEEYPDTPEFDASSIGGRNLRGEKVLHHKMPTLRWCKQNLYSTNDNYGKTELDLLGIVATNVRIPDKYIGIIDGYEIGYAKRSVGNMTVYGQSVLMHGVVNNFDINKPTGAGANVYTSGGNWRTSIWHKGDNSFDNNFELVQLRKDTFRFHAFDILFNKPSIEPTFISSQLKLRKNIHQDGYVEDAEDNANKPLVFLVDYTTDTAERPVAPTVTKYLRKIKTSQYLPSGINTGGFINSRHENTFAGTLAGADWELDYDDSGLRVKGQSFTEIGTGCPDFEETYLINLIAVKANLYTSFYSQSIVSAGDVRPLSSLEPFFGGDIFVCDYTFHTYGRHETNDGWGAGIGGKKAIRRFICESASNIHLRYEVVGNIYSKWYPHNPVTLNDTGNTTYIIEFDRGTDPNQFGYDKSLNALNDLIDSVIYNPFREEITHHPYRIHRGGKNTRTGRPRSWRTFLPLDYYEMQKNMGRLIHLEGIEDRLLIHMENALFYTQDKAKLEAGILSVTLGTGDIFQFEPQPGLSAKLGYAGTQHDLACVHTPMGYVFIDAKMGEMYLYKGQVQHINNGLNNFLRYYLKIKETNIFTGNGATIGWDQKYKRILLSVKNKQLANPNISIKDFTDTSEFWDNIQIGDIVRYNNRLIKYEGINPEDSEFECPPDPENPIYTWDRINPECVENDNGDFIGLRRWNNRARRTNGILDGYIEPNSPNSGLGPYFPPEQTEDCPPPPPEITWFPTGANCEKEMIAHCDDTYSLSPDGTYCYKIEETPATPPSGGIPDTTVPKSLDQYSKYGTVVYDPGFDSNGTGTNTRITPLVAGIWGNPSLNTTDGPLNHLGLWGTTTFPEQTIGFSFCFSTTEEKVLHFGVAADNEIIIRVNGETKLSTDEATLSTYLYTMYGITDPSYLASYTFFHIYPIAVPSGDNVIEVIGRNGPGGGINPAAFGAEIYDNTAAEILAATSYGDLTVLFTTSTLRSGEPLQIGSDGTGYTCPVGYSLNSCSGGTPICQRTLTETPVITEDNTGNVEYTDRCRSIDGYPDGYCEPNLDGIGEGPYFEPVFNDEVCLTEAPPSDLIQVVGIVSKDCNDHDCTQQGQISLSFTFTEPVPVNIDIWVGESHEVFSGPRLFGWEIIPGGVPGVRDPIWEKAFLVSIPAGVTSYTANRLLYGHEVNSSGFNLAWTCHNCLSPITDLYFKLIPPDAGEYELDFVSSSPGVIAHIIV